MKAISASVWEREGRQHALSKRGFAVMLAFWTALGIGSSAAAAWVSRGWHLSIWGFLGLFIIALAGTIIAIKSDYPPFSLLGYAMVTVPFGLMVGPVVALYTAASVAKVFGITSAMVVVLGLVGAFHPGSLEHWGVFLFGGLVVLLLGMIGVPIAAAFGVPVGGALTWLDWIGVALFSGYVIYDFNRAMHVERTHDNAIDCALAIYLDFANIFIRLLSLTGERSSD